MKTVGFQTKLCKPRHPFTKGKVEHLVRFVKDNFLAGRIFRNVTDLNYAALEWCAEQNTAYHKGLGVPQNEHASRCADVVAKLDDSMELLFYLCPERRISFDGFVNYEGRRFGVPYIYSGKTARVMRDADHLSHFLLLSHILSAFGSRGIMERLRFLHPRLKIGIKNTPSDFSDEVR